MSISRSGRRLARCLGQPKPACRKRRLDSRSRAPRRQVQLAGDIAPLLGQATKTVGIAAHLVDVDVGLMVQRPQELTHPSEDRGDVIRLLVLGVGALTDMDVEPEA